MSVIFFEGSVVAARMSPPVRERRERNEDRPDLHGGAWYTALRGDR